MSKLVIRHLEDDVLDKLRELAKSQGQSMEELVGEILRRAVIREAQKQSHMGSRLARRFAGQGLAGEIPELRAQHVKPPRFDR